MVEIKWGLGRGTGYLGAKLDEVSYPRRGFEEERCHGCHGVRSDALGVLCQPLRFEQ